MGKGNALEGLVKFLGTLAVLAGAVVLAAAVGAAIGAVGATVLGINAGAGACVGAVALLTTALSCME